jgi:translation elongation factor EF-Tu-like GTPase
MGRPKGLRKDKATGKWYMPVVHGAESGRTDSSKPNQSNVPKSLAPTVDESPEPTIPHKRKSKPIEWKRNDVAIINGQTVLILGHTKYGMVVVQTLDGERLTIEAHRVESISQWVPEEEEDSDE